MDRAEPGDRKSGENFSGLILWANSVSRMAPNSIFARVSDDVCASPCSFDCPESSLSRRRLARRSLEQLLSWDFDKLILAHGVCVEKDAKAFVRRAFRWLAH